MSPSVDGGAIRRAIRELSLSGHPVCAHASLRSFGHVEGGADAIVDAFVEEGCTLMVASFSWKAFAIPPPQELRPERNGTDYDEGAEWATPHDRAFSTDSPEVDREIGALVGTVVARVGRARGNHPVCSFTAVGPDAERIVARQAPLDVYAPLADLARRDGFVVLMGVGLDRMTLLHLAEKRAGRTLFRRWANAPGGLPILVESGGCSNGFPRLEKALFPTRQERTVGDSLWQVFPAKAALNIATHAIRRDQSITHCGEECIRCDHATAGGPILSP